MVLAIAPEVFGLEIPKRITDETPLIFTLRIRHGDFTLDLSSQITTAIRGRNFSQEVVYDGLYDILRWKIGAGYPWWMFTGNPNDDEMIKRLRRVHGLANVLGYS